MAPPSIERRDRAEAGVYGKKSIVQSFVRWRLCMEKLDDRFVEIDHGSAFGRKLNQNKVSVLSLFHSDRIILLVVDADDEQGN